MRELCKSEKLQKANGTGKNTLRQSTEQGQNSWKNYWFCSRITMEPQANLSTLFAHKKNEANTCIILDLQCLFKSPLEALESNRVCI